MRHLLVLLLLSTTVLAGCSDDAAGPGAEDTTIDGDLTATSDTGVIRGIVVDSTITPVANVTVRLAGTAEATLTNALGEFGFSDLDPGTHFISTSKVGWSSVQQSVDVIAGVERPPLVKFQITPHSGLRPYNQGYQFDGFLACSVRAFAYGMACDALETGVLEDRIAVDYTLDRVPDWVVSELTWESTQQLGDEMSFNIRRTDTNADTVDIEGSSPLSLTMDRAVAEQAEFGAGMNMRIIVFTSHLKETEPPGGVLWGAGLQWEQQFTAFTHVFYNYLPPEDWRFLDDPTVPSPPQ